eukprot:4670229-Amphidinium_carterae.1
MPYRRWAPNVRELVMSTNRFVRLVPYLLQTAIKLQTQAVKVFWGTCGRNETAPLLKKKIAGE